jgi:inhibitor of cysteine peptidase
MIATIWLALLACGSTPKELSVDASFSGKEVKLAVGGSLIVTLESNRSTGFEWGLTSISDESVLELVDNRYEAPPTSDGVPISGAPGQEVWTFKALKKGKSTLSMKYAQPWAQGVEPAKTFALTVDVR